MRDIAIEVKRIRKALEMNQAEFAEALGASQGSVSKWERGVEAPRAEMLIKIQGLFDISERNETSSPFEYGETPVFADIPLTGALFRPTDENLYDGEVESLGTIRLPRHPKIRGPILAWVIPRLGGGPNYKPGEIIFSHRENLDRPDDGEKVIVRESTSNGKFVYPYYYYGRSERGLEWFTAAPQSENTVSLGQTVPVDEREKHGIFPVGIIFASFSYETARNRFWNDVWERDRASYSNSNL